MQFCTHINILANIDKVKNNVIILVANKKKYSIIYIYNFSIN